MMGNYQVRFLEGLTVVTQSAYSAKLQVINNPIPPINLNFEFFLPLLAASKPRGLKITNRSILKKWTCL
jgi:hypothetical protein